MIRMSGGSGMTGTLFVPQVMPPVPMPTSPPELPVPELRPTAPPPLPVTPPAPLEAPELPPAPVSDSPGMPGLNPQPATEEIKRAFTNWDRNRRIEDLRRGETFRTVPHITPIR